MDQETLTNHIVKLGVRQFNIACQLIFDRVFNYHAINVDGKSDGGTDLASFAQDGSRKKTAYQITTQKTDIKNKAYKDALKAINKLGVQSYFFIPTYNLSEIETRKLETQITNELGITANVYNPKTLAGFILSEKLLPEFLDKLEYPLPRELNAKKPEYREQALHSYTLNSKDSKNLKEGIIDDTILYILSENTGLTESEITEQVSVFLAFENRTKEDLIKKRIGSLFGNQKLNRIDDGKIILVSEIKDDISSRKRLYQVELNSMVAAQTDLLTTEYNIEWKEIDSRKTAIWISEAFISDRLSNLKELDISISAHPIFKIDSNSLNRLKSYLIKKGAKKVDVETIIQELLTIASGHPVINKITRASMYVALEGSTPISKAKSLGANRWSDFNILIEPSVAIPIICSQLYKGKVNSLFDLSIQSINRISSLDAISFIPYFYINECAAHLLRARKYLSLDVEEKELIHSSNAFVANYYALKKQGVNLPSSLLEYLATFSPAIKTEQKDIKNWIRAIMTDLQQILNGAGIEYIGVPTFKDDDCIEYEREYEYHLKSYKKDKHKGLIQHDLWALKYTNDQITNSKEHWIILSYDNSLISFSKTDLYNGLVTTPSKFIDITESTKELSDTHFVSLLHSVATYSERTLSAGARIIDRIVKYASHEIQNWEFKQDLIDFKKNLVDSIDLSNQEVYTQIDSKTDEFLRKHGIDTSINEDENVDD